MIDLALIIVCTIVLSIIMNGVLSDFKKLQKRKGDQ